MSHVLEGHEHPVSLINNGVDFECDACDRSYGDGYSCGECKFGIHMECAFIFNINVTVDDHPSHDGHNLKFLTTGAPAHTDPKCHLCGNHSYGYLCTRCRLMVHLMCTSVFESPEITHTAHVRHPLKLITDGAPDYTDGTCHLCGEDTGNLLYHCDSCKFNLNMRCAVKNPRPITLSDLKVHEHTLTLLPKSITFVCDACGIEGYRAPYVCVQCDFMMFHRWCAYLPRVIHVNHHDHRVSYKYPLGPGEWRCGVCWEEIDWAYGAYSCSICPNYAIHSECASSRDVWDGEELDGVPEEIEDIEPFKRNEDNTITHFAHAHNLLILSKDGDQESSLCGACVRPIGSHTFYKCSESYCSFVLHETCAHLPKKKRHFLCTKPLTLSLFSRGCVGSYGVCHQVFSDGFIYSGPLGLKFDLLCSSITVPFIHGSHDHHLLYLKVPDDQVKTCQSCGIDEDGVVVGCRKCDYFLDFHCATLPLTVTLPRYDDHLLTLCYDDKKASSKYWCDICESETNPKTWFYTCKDCGVTLHVFCVVGDIGYAQPGGKVDEDHELLPNNTSSRPLCEICHCRCPGRFIIKDINLDLAVCSYYCYKRCKSYYASEFSDASDRCPPWLR